MNKFGIAVDGPAGAGKSTVVKIIAKELGINYVDSGSIYRTIAYCLKQNDIDVDVFLEMTDAELLETLNAMDIKLEFKDGVQINYLNGEQVEDKLLRTEDVSMISSKASTNGFVREKVTTLCQEVSKTNEVIMEGRDIGSVIMPDALLKVYLDASVEERAQRRIKQLKEQKQKAGTLEEVMSDIEKRDKQDMTREISPLKKVDDAMVLDSTSLTIEEVVKFIVDEYKARKEK